MLGEAATFVTTLNSAVDFVLKIGAATSLSDAKTQGSNLAEMLIKVQAGALQLVQEKAALLDENRALKEQADERADFEGQRNQYKRVRMHTGTFVYRENEAADADQNQPCFCTNCFGNRQLAIIQPAALISGASRCPKCEATFKL